MQNYFRPIALGLLRIVAALMIWQVVAQRLFGLFGGQPAAIGSLGWFAGAAAFVASLALGVGFLTRPAAAILAGYLAALYLFRYLPLGFPPFGGVLGEQIVARLGLAVLLVFTGPGRFSIDADLKRQRPDLVSRWFGDGLEKYYPQALSACRVLIALLYMQHGLPKLGIGGRGSEFLSQTWVAGVMETFGGTALALGLFTVPVAFLTSGQMAFAYFLNHAPRGPFPIQNGGELAGLYCFFFLFLVTAGAGPWALDWFLRRGPKKAAAPSL